MQSRSFRRALVSTWSEPERDIIAIAALARKCLQMRVAEFCRNEFCGDVCCSRISINIQQMEKTQVGKTWIVRDSAHDAAESTANDSSDFADGHFYRERWTARHKCAQR